MSSEDSKVCDRSINLQVASEREQASMSYGGGYGYPYPPFGQQYRPPQPPPQAQAPQMQHMMYGHHGGPPGGMPPPPPGLPPPPPSSLPHTQAHAHAPIPHPPPPPPPPPSSAPYPPPPPPPPSSEDASGAAPPPPPPPPPPAPDSSVNQFNNDGSFLDDWNKKVDDKKNEEEREDEEFRALEAKLIAEREAHAKRIAAENNKKRKVAAVTMNKRPLFGSRGIKPVTKVFSLGDDDDDEQPKKGDMEKGGSTAAAAAAGAGGEKTQGSASELSEAAKAAIRRTAEFFIKNPEKKDIILQKCQGDVKFKFLYDKGSAEHDYYLQLLKEARIEEKVKSVSSGIDEVKVPPITPYTSRVPGHSPAASPTPMMLQPPSSFVAKPSPSPLSSSMVAPVAAGGGGSSGAAAPAPRKRKNRWGDATPESDANAAAIKQYLPKVMDEDAEKQLKEQKKMQLLEQRIREAALAQVKSEAAKKREVELFQERVQHYEELAEKDDDSFKDTVEMAEQLGGVIEGGTWEHRKRAKEMLKTAESALGVTLVNKGKHHIAQFLPKDELEAFLKNADAVAAGEAPMEKEDFEANKLDDSNIGMQLLQKAGWKEGEGLGADGSGITNPLNMNATVAEAAGVGVQATHELEENDDIYDQYRKRMMLAYRFRPNPLNNPRRSYY